MLRRALVEVIAGRCTAGTGKLSAATLSASPEQDQIICDNLGHILFLAGLLVVPGTRLEPALNVDLATLLQVLTGDLGESLPEHHVVPFGAILPLSGFIFKTLVGRDRDLCHCRALRRVFNLRIFAQISNQLNAVQTFTCHTHAPLEGFTIAECAGAVAS